MLAERRLQTFLAKVGKAQTGARRRLGNKTMIGQSRDGVDFQNLRRAALIDNQIDAREAAGSEGGTGVASALDDSLDPFGGNVRIEKVPRGGIFVFRFEVEERPVSFDLDRREGPVVEHS